MGTEIKKVERNMNIEILRVFSLFLIFFCHYLYYNCSECTGSFLRILVYWADKMTGQTGVCCFLLITGYFMVDKSFRLSRVIKTDIQVIVYSLLLCISYYLLMFMQAFPASIIPYWKGLPEITTIFQSVFPVWNSVYWFATAYIFLLFISPVLNILIFRFSARQHMMVILGLTAVSIWQLLSKFSAYWNNLLYVVIIYMIGAWIRLYADRIQVPHIRLKMSCVIGGAALLLLLFSMEYVSKGFAAQWFKWSGHSMLGGVPVLPMAVATCIFYAVARRPSRSCDMRRLAPLIAPAMFGVYLLHGNQVFAATFWYAVNLCIPSVTGPAMIAVNGVSVIVLFIVLTVLSLMINTVLVTPITGLVMRSSLMQRISRRVDHIWNFDVR